MNSDIIEYASRRSRPSGRSLDSEYGSPTVMPHSPQFDSIDYGHPEMFVGIDPSFAGVGLVEPLPSRLRADDPERTLGNVWRWIRDNRQQQRRHKVTTVGGQHRRSSIAVGTSGVRSTLSCTALLRGRAGFPWFG